MSINTLDDYVWRSLPQWGGVETNPNLRKKVDEQGNLLPFGGNTVVSSWIRIPAGHFPNFRRNFMKRPAGCWRSP